MANNKLIFEKSKDGRQGFYFPKWNGPQFPSLDDKYTRKGNIGLPSLSESEIVRHYVNLSTKNHHVDKGFYPLGSCTMKYNPFINEVIASMSAFSDLHPYQDEEDIQGALQVYYETAEMLSEISGMDKVSLIPAAGAHGEWTSLKIIRAYHSAKGNPRKKVIIPDSAHGTNPASIIMAGYEVVELKSDSEGLVDINALREACDEDTAAFMITNPNTLGLFEKNVDAIQEIVHSKGALLYMDGANFNALLGIARPGDMGFDVMHYNLHKTFSTPHGGGGPGCGAIGVKDFLSKYLPKPDIILQDGIYKMDSENKDSIGRVHSFYGNYGIVVRAYTYLKMVGYDGLKRISENAIINANYIKKMLADVYDLPYEVNCMHEVIFSSQTIKELTGVKTLDIAKRLLDFDIHAPTIYFPLLVSEAMMIEPTETEGKETLDRFVRVMKNIAEEAKTNPEKLKTAPLSTEIGRLDEAYAAKSLDVNYFNK